MDFEQTQMLFKFEIQVEKHKAIWMEKENDKVKKI